MNHLTLTAAALGALSWTGVDANVAEAAHPYCSAGGRGIHFGGRNFHFDVGRPQIHSTYWSSSFGLYHPRHRVAARPHLDWRDASHWDWRPTQYIRHGHHFDVVPGRYDYHRQRHWDVHYGGRHRRY